MRSVAPSICSGGGRGLRQTGRDPPGEEIGRQASILRPDIFSRRHCQRRLAMESSLATHRTNSPRPFDGKPETREETDDNGNPSFRVIARVLTPVRAKWPTSSAR